MKKLNAVAGTGNPVYITDLTALSETIQLLANAINNFGRAAYIMGGFEKIDNNTYTSGILWFNGQAYSFDGATVPAGQYLFAGKRDISQRVTSDGQTYNAYSEYYLFTSASNTSPDGVLVDSRAISDALIADLKAPLIPNGAITSLLLAANSVTAEKIQNNSVTAEKIANFSITAAKIAVGAVVSGTIADRAVTEPTIATGAVTAPKIANYAITKEKLIVPYIFSAGRISSNGTIMYRIGGSFTVTKGSETGTYTINHSKGDNAFIPMVCAESGIAYAYSINGDYFTVKTFNVNGIPTDNEFYFYIVTSN